MPTLPDINTDNVSFLAFWNPINHGADSIAPSEVTSDGNISNTTTYDNGIEGDYALSTGRTATFRVKNDGWFVVYIDRSESYKQNDSDPLPEGPWDILRYPYGGRNGTDIPQLGDQNALERAINNMYNELSNSGSISYNSPDVGLINYESGATGITTYFSDYTEETDNTTINRRFQYSSGVTLVRAWAGGTTGSEGSSANAYSRFQGSQTVDLAVTTGGSGKSGIIDCLAYGPTEDNIIPNDSTNYGHDIDSYFDDPVLEASWSNGWAIIVWE